MTESYKGELNTVKAISSSVLEQYSQLATLEAEGKKDSIDFERALERLNSSISLEESLLGEICKNFEKMITIRDYLSKAINMDEITALVQGNQEELIKYRIFMKLGRYLTSEVKDWIKYLNLFPLTMVLEKSAKEKFSILALKYKKQIEEEFFLLELILIERNISSTYDKSEKADLIKAKYLRIFTNNYLEQQLLSANFIIPENVCFMAPSFYASLNGLPSSYFKSLSDSKRDLMYYEAINNLMKSGRGSLQLERDLRKIQIQVSLEYYSEDEINELNTKFHDIVEDNPYNFNDENVETIASAYKSRKNNKKLIMKIGFNN